MLKNEIKIEKNIYISKKKKQMKRKNIILVNNVIWGGKNPLSFSLFLLINLILNNKIKK